MFIHTEEYSYTKYITMLKNSSTQMLLSLVMQNTINLNRHTNKHRRSLIYAFSQFLGMY